MLPRTLDKGTTMHTPSQKLGYKRYARAASRSKERISSTLGPWSREEVGRRGRVKRKPENLRPKETNARALGDNFSKRRVYYQVVLGKANNPTSRV